MYSVGLRYRLFEEMRSIKVFKQSDPFVSVSLAVFQIHEALRKKAKPKHTHKAQDIEARQGEELYLPCISPNPKVQPKLFKKMENLSEAAFPYEITRGFKTKLGNESADVQPGEEYVCYRNRDAGQTFETDVPDFTFYIKTRKCNGIGIEYKHFHIIMFCYVRLQHYTQFQT